MTSTTGRSPSSNSLHGTLRLLSKTYNSKINKRRKLLLQTPRTRTRTHTRSSRFVPTTRKASNRRSDRLQLVIIDNHDDGDDDDGDGDDGDDDNVDRSKSKTPTQPAEVKESSSSKTKVKLETSAAAPAAPASMNSDDNNSNEKEKDEKKTTITEKKRPLKPKTTRTRTILLHPEDLKRYEEAEAAQRKALKNIETARLQVYNDQVQQVWGVYTYGLKHVLALNDLSDAPDSILPGNFC